MTKIDKLRAGGFPSCPFEKGEKLESSQTNKEGLKIIPIGGLDRIGMNITAFEYGDSIVVVDSGCFLSD